MRISRKAEYALHTILYLLVHTDRAVPLAALAKHQGVSSDYLAKVMQKLSGEGIVTAITGPGGGYRIAREPGSVSFADVVSLFDSPDSVYSCLYKERDCDRYPECTIIHVINQAVQDFFAALEKTTFLDLLNRGDPAKAPPKWIDPEED